MARDDFHGLDLTHAVNRLPPRRVAGCVNVRPYSRDGFSLRNQLSAPISQTPNSIQRIARLNDTTPAGPAGGYSIISVDSGGVVYCNGVAVATGLSGNPVSLVPFRPNTSVQPWMYIGDSAPSPNVSVTGGFTCGGMIKVRSDGLCRAMGIAEPTAFPTPIYQGQQIPASIPGYVYFNGNNSAAYVGAYEGGTSQGLSWISGVAYGYTNPGSAVDGDQTTYATADTTGFPHHGYCTCIWGFQWSGVIPTNLTIGVLSSVPTSGSAGRSAGIWYSYDGGTTWTQVYNASYRSQQWDTIILPANTNPSDVLVMAFFDSHNYMVHNVYEVQLGVGAEQTYYRYVYRASETGAQSNPSPASLAGFNQAVISASVQATGSPDPQVDSIDFYRQGGALANYTYVGTIPNSYPSAPIPFLDTLTDLDVATNQILLYSNFQPFPSIDLPRKGVLNAAGGTLTWASGDVFNTRWLPGTIILIETPPPSSAQVAYTLVVRPASTLSLYIPTVPDGASLSWSIGAPALAAQPLPYMFGPTDNINFVFAVGDSLRPGVLYWCSGSNLDDAPDTNQMDVTDPSEPLINGAMSGGVGVVFSNKRAWVIVPNFYNALATVTGTTGSTWTLQATSINRGLFMPWCVAVEGGGKIFFRVEDGVHVSKGGLTSASITDDSLYPLFPHEGSSPVAITRQGMTFYPPDDTKPEAQKFSIVGDFLYYDYVGIDGNPHTLVYDIAAEAWILDTYEWPATAHADNTGESVKGTLVGGNDGSIRSMSSSGTETVTATLLTAAVAGVGWQHAWQYTVEYSSNAPITLTGIAADAGNGSYGPPAITLPSTGGLPTKYTFKVGQNKYKWMWFKFVSTDPTFQVFLGGFVIDAKDFGSAKSYVPVRPFASKGGEGGEP